MGWLSWVSAYYFWAGFSSVVKGGFLLELDEWVSELERILLAGQRSTSFTFWRCLCPYDTIFFSLHQIFFSLGFVF